MSDWNIGRSGDPYNTGPPPLVDQRFGHGHIPPPLGAASGHWSQPDLFNAFPGAQQHQSAWGGPGLAGGPSPWTAMGQMSPGPNNHSGWTHGQYQPSPPNWQQRSPFEHPGAPPHWPMSAPPGGPTGWEMPTGPSPGGGFGGGAALGGLSDPITPGGFGGVGANPYPPAWGGPGNHSSWGGPGPSPGGWPNSAGGNPQGGWLGPGAEAANQWAGPSSAGAWPGLGPGNNSPHGFPHHPLSRSNSQHGGSTPYRGILKRSNSFGGHSPWSAPSPRLGEHGEFHEQKLAKRPRDWRADYTPRFGISSIIPGRDHSDIIEYSDSTRRTLNPLLAYTGSSSTPALLHDLRQDPSSIQFPAIGRQHNDLDYAQLATNPPTNFMRLYHPKFPWYIDIKQSHPNGITIHDVLGQLSQQMFKLITPRHFYNQVLNEGDRHQINNAFRERCQGHPELIARGVLHVDFFAIEGKFMWIGLAKKNGMWEIKMR